MTCQNVPHLVRGGGHHVGVVKGRRDHLRGDKPADVRHVRQQVRAALEFCKKSVSIVWSTVGGMWWVGNTYLWSAISRMRL